MNMNQQERLHPMNTHSKMRVAPSQGRDVAATYSGVASNYDVGNLASQMISRTTTVVDGSKEESSEQGDDTDFESETDEEKSTAKPQQILEQKRARQPSSKKDLGVSPNDLTVSQDGTVNLSTVDPVLLGEIRRMIQQEFGVFNTLPVVVPQQPSQAQPEAHHPQGGNSASNSAATGYFSQSIGHESNSNKVRPRALFISPRTRHVEPVQVSGLPEKTLSPHAVASSSPERQTVVRFADDVPEKSVLDGKWGELFDKKGVPTERLKQVLKGLARYVTDEFMPQNSIVIPPEKMAALYSLHKLQNEIFPYVAVFKCRSKGWNMALADIYQDLACEYHLIQKDDGSKPSIPALTPAGFAKWIATGIVANPDIEASRLNKIFSELPIDADGTAERLPKQVPRHLLPTKSDKTLRRLLDDCMGDFIDEFLPASSSSPRDPPKKVETLSEKRGPSSYAPSSSGHKRPNAPARTESSPQPRTTKLDKYDERDNRESSRTTHKSMRDHQDNAERTSHGYYSTHDSHAATRRHSPPARPPVGPLARTHSEQVSPTTKSHPTISLPPLPAIASPRPPPPTRTRTSGVTDTHPTSTKDALIREIRDRETDYHAYAPRSSVSPCSVAGSDYAIRSADEYCHTPRSAASDFTPRSLGVAGVVSRRDVDAAAAVPKRSESVNPGPTWDQYLSSRTQGVSGRLSGVAYQGSI